MTLSEEQKVQFLEAAKPLIRWMAENTHPHCEAKVDCTSAALSEELMLIVTEEFVK